MTKTIQEFAELNGYAFEKAHSVIEDFTKSDNPAFAEWAEELIEQEDT